MSGLACVKCGKLGEIDEKCDCPESQDMRERSENQLKEWVVGRPKHNDVEDECCPDFSCCGASMAPRETREAFYQADERARMLLLFGFLGAAFTEQKRGGNPIRTYIAGDPTTGMDLS